MPHNRFFIREPFKKIHQIKGLEFHHLKKVMRLKTDEKIELINGLNYLAEAVITEITSSNAFVEIVNLSFQNPKITSLILAQAKLKQANLEYVVQKGTELGVTHFHFFKSKLSCQKTPSKNQILRLHCIIISALKQCGRLDMPTISWEFPNSNKNIFFADLSQKKVMLNKCSMLPATLIVGPEKGFTSEEIQRFQKLGHSVSLSPHILRAETAAISGIAILANNAL